MTKITAITVVIVILMNCYILANTIVVDIEGTGDYTTIQEGINNTIDGDVVLVYPGTYIENVNFNGHSITLASLELTTGNDAYVDSTIIDGNRTGSCVTVINNEDAVIRGFTITNGRGNEWPNEDSRGGGILASNWFADDTELDVINCIIKNNIARSGGGIFVSGAAPKIFPINLSGVTIKNNYSVVGGGIDDHFARPNFDPNNLCSIYNNHAGLGQDIYAYDSCHIHVVVDTFTVMDPEGYYTEYIDNQNIGSFTYNIQHAWMEEINHDLYIAPDGDDNNSGLSPDDPFKTIALATYRIASDSLDPKTVHVAEGTYSKSLNGQIFPISMKSNTSLIGENINTKIIHDDDFYLKTIYFKNMKKNINIMNFTINTECTINSVIYSSKKKNKNFKFENLIFEDIVCDYGSVFYINYSDSVLYKNILFNNIESNDVACIFNGKYNAKVENCVFSNNYSHGVFSFILKINAHEYGIIKNCIFDNNSNNNADITLFILSYFQFCNPTLEVKNSIITNNSTPSVSVMSCSSTDPIGEVIITNNTFSQNEAQRATLTVGGNVDISNNIMWDDNTTAEIFVWDLSNYGIISTLNLQYNNIKNGVDGVWNQNNANIVNWLEGNINEDPQFTGTGDFPYALSDTSPCIDSGTPDTTGLYLPLVDLAGNPRVYGGRIDMGAYEWQGYSVDPDTNVVNNLYYFKNSPNPFKNETMISFTSLDYERVRDYTLSIYNSRGQLVRRFYGEDEYFWAINEVVWDGKDMNGNITAPGVYFYSLEYEDTAVVRKMIRLR